MLPLISIIVPVYNSEKYLDDCIRSIKEQTYQNIEIILVNDGSKDKSLLKCIEYANIDVRIKVIDKENGGASSARNKGLEIARGKYIVFIDSDDIISPIMVKTLYSLALKRNAEIAICEIERFTKAVNKLENKNNDNSRKTLQYTGKEYLKELILGNTDCSPCNKIYLKETIGNTRFIEGRINEDKLFLFELYQKCSIIVKTKEILYYYRFNNESVTSLFSTKSLDVLTNLKDIGNQIEEKGLGLDKEFQLSWIRANIIMSRRICVNKKNKEFRVQYRDCCKVIKANIFTILFNRYFNLRLKAYAILNILYIIRG